MSLTPKGKRVSDRRAGLLPIAETHRPDPEVVALDLTDPKSTRSASRPYRATLRQTPFREQCVRYRFLHRSWNVPPEKVATGLRNRDRVASHYAVIGIPYRPGSAPTIPVAYGAAVIRRPATWVFRPAAADRP